MTDHEADREIDGSSALVERARRVIPGGAQTGLRSQFYESGSIALEAADGASVTTVDGTALTDYHLAFGPILLGHGYEPVDRAVRETIDRGVLYGAGTTRLEVEVAERLVELYPGIEMVNFCNSGSEATYHAIRLARAATGNDLVVKFEGCYHGWHDYVDVSVHPPQEAIGTPYPESDGMLASALERTLVVPFNDPAAFRSLMATHGGAVAAVILEPIPHSVGCLEPTEEFLDALVAETSRYDVPLVFDEIITGFRHALGGVQSELGITPDLTCLGKALGNGYPVAAIGGRRELLSQAGDGGRVVISGTYSGHPIGLAAARETLRALDETDVVGQLAVLGEQYRSGLRDLIDDRGVEARVVGYRSIFGLQFGLTEQPRTYGDVIGIDRRRFRRYAGEMRERGHFFTPNPYKRHHLSLAHERGHLESYLEAADEVLATLARG